MMKKRIDIGEYDFQKKQKRPRASSPSPSPNPDPVELPTNINTLTDLIQLAESNVSQRNNAKRNSASSSAYTTYYTRTMCKKLQQILPELKELEAMIGMDTIKSQIVKQIVYFAQEFHSNNEMLHVVIQGPPGVGKTTFARILGKIYCNLGVIKPPPKKIIWNPSNSNSDATNHSPPTPSIQPPTPCQHTTNTTPDNEGGFMVARRSDLIGQYLGTTAIKTQAVIERALGGVLFIDEVYSLAHCSKNDMYSKECIDTINLNLSEKKGQLLCIVAGYEEEIESCFFSLNPGLRRRFPFVYTMEPYSPKDLMNIFLRMLEKPWKISSQALQCDNSACDSSACPLLDLFKTNASFFTNSGGDVELLVFRSKIEHSRRVFLLPRNCQWKLTVDDVQAGLKSLIASRKGKDNYVAKDNPSAAHMYL